MPEFGSVLAGVKAVALRVASASLEPGGGRRSWAAVGEQPTTIALIVDGDLGTARPTAGVADHGVVEGVRDPAFECSQRHPRALAFGDLALVVGVSVTTLGGRA
jgi:hypothetical protein